MNNKKGITLIELLVVLVIISIVSGIGFVVFSNVVDNAQKDTLLLDAINVDKEFDKCKDQSGCFDETFFDVDGDSFYFDGTEVHFSKDVVIYDMNMFTITLRLSDKYELTFDMDDDLNPATKLTKDDIIKLK